MANRCPGSHLLPASVFWRNGKHRCVCRRCGREYGFVVNGPMRPHIHNGLPPRDDGGCPYHCDPTCDFDCYFS